MTAQADDAGELPVGEVARLAGITVRTLHHYDEIGLLRPGHRSAAGYRLYTSADVSRLQAVLAYRELGFGLDEIARLLDDDLTPADELARLRRQHDLLSQRIGRLRRVLATLDATMEAHMNGTRLTPAEKLEVFGEHDPDRYAEEVEQRWGDTDAYRESARRTEAYGKQDWLRIKAEAQGIDDRLARLMTDGVPATSPEAMGVAREHREHVSRWFYDCPPAMHAALADMYLADERFTKHYEDVAVGLARYVHDAIHADVARVAAEG